MKEIGVIKWYHDKATDGKYGFIECPKYDAVFFHQSEVKEGIPEKNLREGEVVLFVPVPSQKLEEKWKAEEVSLISSPEEYDQITKCYFNYFLDPFIQEKFPLFLKGLFAHIKKHLQMIRQDGLSKERYEDFKEAVLNTLKSEKNNTKNTYTHILDQGLILFPDFDKATFGLIQGKISPALHYAYWKEKKTYVFPITHLLNQKTIFDQGVFSEIARRTPADQLLEFYTLQIEQFLGPSQSDFLNEIKKTIESAKKYIPSHFKNFLESIDHQLTSSTRFALWNDGLIDYCPSEVIDENWQVGDFKFSEKALQRVKPEQKSELAELFHQSMTYHWQGQENSYPHFKQFYTQVKKLVSAEVQLDLVRKNRSFFAAFDQIELWKDQLDDTCPVEVILDKIEELHRLWIVDILFVANLEEVHLILRGLVFAKWEKITDSEQLQILRIAKDELAKKGFELKDDIKKRVYQISTTSINLQLWLEDFHEYFEFDLYKPFVITLPSPLQKVFLKKVFYYINTGRVSLSIEDLTNLNVIDYATAKASEAIDGVALDYSISIVLHCISELKAKALVKENSDSKRRILDIILKQVKDPKDILQIHGFFDTCKGRAVLEKQKSENKEGENAFKYTITRKEGIIPPNHFICDGRLAREKMSQQPSLDEASGFQFWWCANQKCFDPCRKVKTPTDWKNYSIQDFLHILNIDYEESGLVIYLSLINKINRFLDHLKCTACKYILHPTRQSNYAFYGVNHFHCTNESCQEKGKEIYISHCLNGRCDGTIDSRTSVKCRPEGFEQDSCGWYVCNDCHACCSSEKLNTRKYVAEAIQKTIYKCHTVGHKDLGIICCNHCGSPMDSVKANMEEYLRILKWLIENRGKSKYIEKSGKTKFDKWWFLLRAKDNDLSEFHQKLMKYHKVGFEVPDLGKEKSLQLVSEPFSMDSQKSNQLECFSCGNYIDLNEFPEKKLIMKDYHKNATN